MVYRQEQGLSFVEANGIRFAYVTRGEGPLVLLLHGFPDTPHTWDSVLQPLADAGFRAVAPFMRGYAPTEIPAADPTIETLANDALALIDALGEESAHVVGHDWGAAAAYAAVCLAPKRVKTLTAVGLPFPLAVKPSPRLAIAARHFVTLRFPWAARKMRRRDFAQVETLCRRWSPTWRFSPEDLEAVKNAFAAPGCLDAAIGYYRAAPWIKAPKFYFNRVPVKTLCFAGADDPAMPLETYDAARAWFDAPCDVVTLPGGHFLHRESTDAFREELISFLKGQR